MRARRAMAALFALAGCGGGAEVASVTMQLGTSGLMPSDVAAVELLVFDGANAGCARALSGASPLDDSGLVVVAHALFTVDGTPKHLMLPAARKLVFYAEAFPTAAPNRTRIGRGCVEATLRAGASDGVSITLTGTGE